MDILGSLCPLNSGFTKKKNTQKMNNKYFLVMVGSIELETLH